MLRVQPCTHPCVCVVCHREVGQNTYVTPTSYLELIYTYKQLLGAQQAAVDQLRKRYEVGRAIQQCVEGWIVMHEAKNMRC